MSRSILALVIILTLPAASFAAKLTVAVAANVQSAFAELKSVFESDTGIQIKGIIGSSGKLTAQIENGAPFDVFLSADTDYPQTLYKKGLTYNAPRIYGYGTLILWTLENLDLSQGMQILTAPSIQKIAVPMPKTSPYGRQAISALKHYQLYAPVSPKLVYGESIAQTNQFITSRAGDIGFTAKSVVMSPNTKNQGTWIEIEKDAYEPLAQAVVILKHAKIHNQSCAQEFYDFLFSKKAQDIFYKHGYTLP